MTQETTVVGGGLTGNEASYQLAKKGVEVHFYEMYSIKITPAYEAEDLAKLVCINSVRGDQLTNVVGLLEEETHRLNSLILRVADATKILAGGALAVDHELLSKRITNKLAKLDNLHFRHEEITGILNDGITTIVTEPLTSDDLTKQVQEFSGISSLYFFDTAAPVVASDSVNVGIVYKESHYGRGGAVYLNCPMGK